MSHDAAAAPPDRVLTTRRAHPGGGPPDPEWIVARRHLAIGQNDVGGFFDLGQIPNDPTSDKADAHRLAMPATSVTLELPDGTTEAFTGREAEAWIIPDLRLPDGRLIDGPVLAWTGEQRHPDGALMAYAGVVAVPLSKGRWAMSASIDLPNKHRNHRLQPNNDGSDFVTIDTTKQPDQPEDGPGRGGGRPAARDPDVAVASEPSAAVDAAPQPSAAAAFTNPVIDVMLGLDSTCTGTGCVAWPQNIGWLVTALQGVHDANTAFANSGMTQRLRLIRVESVPFETTGVSRDDRTNLRTGLNGASSFRALRDVVGADLVGLIVHCPTDYGGLAAIPDPAGSPDQAFMVLCEQTASGGVYSIAHEFGHLQGAGHAAATEDGTFAYSHAYRYDVAGSARRTVLAETCVVNTACPRVLQYSSPSVNLIGLKDVPSGLAATNDNRRTMEEMEEIVATYLAPPWRSQTFTVAAGALASTPDTTYIGNGQFMIVARTTGNDMASWIWSDATNDITQTLSPVRPSGGLGSEPRVTSRAAGFADAVVRGANGAIWIAHYANGSWGSFYSLGSSTNLAPDAVDLTNSWLAVFATAITGQVIYRTYNASAQTWTGWSGIPGKMLSSAPSVTSWGNSRVDLVARSGDRLFHTDYSNVAGSPSVAYGQYWSELPGVGWYGNPTITDETAPYTSTAGQFRMAIYGFRNEGSTSLSEVLYTTLDWTSPITVTSNVPTGATVGCGADSMTVGYVFLACRRSTTATNQLQTYRRGDG